MSQRFKKYLIAAWVLFKSWAVKAIKSGIITFALKKVLGTAAAGGFKGWVVKYLATELFEEVVSPLVKFMVFRESEYQVDVINGKVNIKKLKKARGEGNDQDYDDVVDTILN